MTHAFSYPILIAIAAVLTCLPAGAQNEKTLAFPGAEGFGAYAKGGRGGRVLFVTNLEDYIPGRDKPIQGSLRAACAAKGPRTILFRVSGTISLKRQLEIKEPRITIAGQSAPGGGVCLKDYSMTIETHDAIVRHIRLRPGDVMKKELDALTIVNSENVIIDHCSASWSIDETLSATEDSKNLTVQWCVISESLTNSYHHKGKHGYGSLIRGVDGGMSFHHNIYAHHSSRNPRPGGYPGDPGLIFDFRNNVIYNWGGTAGYNGEERLRMNYIGNYLKPGPSTTERRHAFKVGGTATRIYTSENYFEGAEAANQDNWKMIRQAGDENRAPAPFPAPAVETQTARGAFRDVLQDCGATLPRRDAVDRRVIETIRNGTGALIDSQSQVGGWPELESGAPPLDTDNDGMPDFWEAANGLDPARPGANADSDNDGYTNLEEFLNRTNPMEIQGH